MKTAADSQLLRMPALDGLRGIAVIAVMVFHFRWIFDFGPDRISRLMSLGLSFGWMGVDLFFVLSGFLITGILIDTRDSPRYFRSFYGRRAVRIFPLYYAALAIALGAGPFLMPALLGVAMRHVEPLWYVFYLANWQPGSHGVTDPLVFHFWSLCVEEQFYIVWPTLVWFTPTRRLPLVTLLVGACSLLIRLVAVQWGPGETINRITLTRMDGLALGSWVAAASRNPMLRQWLSLHVRRLMWLGLTGMAGVVLAEKGFNPNGPVMQGIGYSLLAIVFAGLVFLAADASGPLRTVLAFRPLTIAGTFSYAMYVFHVPLDSFLRKMTERILAPLPVPAALAVKAFYVVAMIGLMYGIGWLSWNIFEKHLLALKRYFPYSHAGSRAANTRPEHDRNIVTANLSMRDGAVGGASEAD